MKICECSCRQRKKAAGESGPAEFIESVCSSSSSDSLTLEEPLNQTSEQPPSLHRTRVVKDVRTESEAHFQCLSLQFLKFIKSRIHTTLLETERHDVTLIFKLNVLHVCEISSESLSACSCLKSRVDTRCQFTGR